MADRANLETDIIYLDGIIERLRKRSERVNEFWLKAIGKRLRKLKNMDPSDAAGIAAIRNDTEFLADLTDRIQKAGDDTMEDAKGLLETAARLSVEAAPVAKSFALHTWISGIAQATLGKLYNISKTTAVGVVTPSGFRAPKEAYIEAIDEIAAKLTGGEIGLHTAVRRVMDRFADSGLSVVEYESGHTRNLGSAIEMNLKQAVHDVYQGAQDEVGKEFGADGVEISAHADCAPDHLDIQGKQYTLEEWEKVNGALYRKLGTWNCRHKAYPIIMGITPPTYSDEELKEMKAKSLAVTEFDGKQMTTYEATQVQRRLEREIRKQKNRAIIAKEAGEDQLRREAQQKINELTSKYTELSNAFGLRTQKKRMEVPGFRPVKVNPKNK